MKTVLEVSNLTKYYGDILAVKDLSLKLKEGEVFGFIGPNGAGKSTTIRSILNLINKTEGKVFFKGENLEKNRVDLKCLIGYLPSEINLYEDLTVKEILNFHESFYNKDLSKRKNELIKRLQLDESRKIEELSLGNLKKLGIILALMHEPILLILDEPTSGLDPIIQQEFFEILKEEKAKGTTIFYSTHILSEIVKICDRVGIIKSGKILKIEPINDLLNKNLNYVTVESKEIDKIAKVVKENIILSNKNTIKFKNSLTANELLKLLSKFNIEKLYIEQANLEEVLLHYYK